MRWLLGGVFLFFGAHTLFWLPRSIRERKRAASSRRVPDATESEK
jgi:hypothetical protein